VTEETDHSAFKDADIYQDIVTAIFEQKLLPGTQLKEDELRAIYAVSRARIREVLLRLAHDKFVTRISNRGAFVAKPTVAEAREVFATRRLIEGHLVRLLAERGDQNIHEVLKRQIDREARARRRGDFSEIIREGGEFHFVLAEIAGCSILSRFLRELLTLTSLISVAYQRGNVVKCEMDEHRELAVCISAGRADDAEALMNAHLDGILSRLDLSLPREPQADLHQVLGRGSLTREAKKTATN